MRKTSGPKRRNTLTIDDDNAVRLERLRKERDLSFKQVVNDVLRRGLSEAEKPFRPAEPFRTRVYDPGPPLRPNLNPDEMLDELDLEYARKKKLVPE